MRIASISLLTLLVFGLSAPDVVRADNAPAKAAPLIALEEMAAGFSRPIQFVSDPSEEGRLYVVEQEGLVVPLKVGAADERDPILDIKDAIGLVPEGGLLGFAFHPKYPEVPRAYAHYIGKSREIENRISEFILSPGSPAGQNEERKLIRLSQVVVHHLGGQVAFGPDGFLYIGIGDGSAQNDPKETGQNFGDQWGSMLRIDVEEQAATNQPYLAPVDNPFVGGRGHRDVWAGGFRDPKTFSFDSKTNNLYVGDSGTGLEQEVDIVKPGGNYGWSVFDGAGCLRMKFECMNQKYQPPIASYLKQDGGGVTVGFVYRGKLLPPELDGVLFYGDRVSGKIWGVKYEDEKVVSNTLLLQTDKDISAFGQKSNGELLVADYKTGKIFRIVPAQAEKTPAQPAAKPK